MSKITLEPRKNPRQRRSEFTREVILEAAARVLSKKSLEGFNTNYVAEIAGVSIGTLYQYFPNKESLIAVLIERTQKDYETLGDQLSHDTEGMSFHDALLEMAIAAVNYKYNEPLLAAALDHQEQRLSVEHILIDTEQRCVEGFKTFLLRYPEFSIDLPDYVPRDCFTISKAMVEGELRYSTMTPSDLAVRITCALMGYLKEIIAR
jgi:AcrR family transcriptional regulator